MEGEIHHSTLSAYFPSHFIELAPPACDCSHVSSPMCAVSINHVIVNPAGHINSHPGWKTVLMV